mmetsp:Transcript_8085/g.14643  ORF Transcript_8085/g.14643 Transcript_8085/m.14643 type:complete len:82 (-) Transcript_8085:251-496(-)
MEPSAPEKALRRRNRSILSTCVALGRMEQGISSSNLSKRRRSTFEGATRGLPSTLDTAQRLYREQDNARSSEYCAIQMFHG